MQKRFLECGRVASTHGIRGEVRFQPWCDGFDFLQNFDALYLDKGTVRLEVEQIRPHKNIVIIKLKGYEDLDAAVTLRGKVLYIDREDVKLGEGEFFIQDLIGLRVLDADSGELYGELCDVTETGANDVYHVRFPDGSIKLVPAIKQVIIETDIKQGEIKIRPMEGLFDDEN